MKKYIALASALVIILSLAACGGQAPAEEAEVTAEPTAEPTEEPAAEEAAPAETEPPAPAEEPAAEETGNKVLVAYFSCTGNTAGAAEKIAAATGADIYEIAPAEPYTEEDLNYGSEESRTSKEQNDPDARPAISGGVEDMGQYDTVFLGYPIWWGQAPKILYTFVESYDLSGKTIVPFCTSGSSGIGSSAENLRGAASGGDWLEGGRFAGGAAESDIAEWLDGLGLTDAEG